MAVVFGLKHNGIGEVSVSTEIAVSQPKHLRWAIHIIFLGGLPVLFVAFHWKHFFPIPNPDELRFQLSGELASALVFALSVIGIDRILTHDQMKRRQFEDQPAWLRGGLDSLPVATGIIAVNWREYFQDHQLQWRPLLESVLIYTIGVCLSGFFLARIIDRKFDDEDEET